jgi:hypothetical protein
MMHDQIRADALRATSGAFPATARNSELAAALLDVVNESELETFVGGLVAETARNAGRRLGVEAGQALVAELRRTAERTLPALTVALGHQALPAAPAAAQNAARTFGLELEGMSAEDRDFEIARRFVGFAQAATVRAAGPARPS